MNNNNKNRNRNTKTNKKQKHSNLKQSCKLNKKSINDKRAWFSDMNQIDWYPVDPYCD